MKISCIYCKKRKYFLFMLSLIVEGFGEQIHFISRSLGKRKIFIQLVPILTTDNANDN